MAEEDRRVLCDGGEIEDLSLSRIARWVLLCRVKRIAGAEVWVKEYEEGDDDTHLSLLLG